MHFVLVLVEIKVAVQYSKATENVTSLFLLIFINFLTLLSLGG